MMASSRLAYRLQKLRKLQQSGSPRGQRAIETGEGITGNTANTGNPFF
jgi:hypothetical protein